MRSFLLILVTLSLILFILSRLTLSFPLEKSTPILNSGDLPGFYFDNCQSHETSLSDGILGSLEEFGIESKLSSRRFVEIDESWYSEPSEIIQTLNKPREFRERGYQCVTVKRITLSSRSEALEWLDIAIKCNFFTNYSGKCFVERSYTGRKIGDKCFLLIPDKRYIDGEITFAELMKTWPQNDKTLYFVKNNVAVYLSSHYVFVKTEIPATWIENLAEKICSRL